MATPKEWEEYEEKREHVFQGDNTDVFAARDTAYEWHGGQYSALYSFASTDCTIWSEEHRSSLVQDINSCIQRETASTDKDQEEVLEALNNLLAVVKALPIKPSAPACDKCDEYMPHGHCKPVLTIGIGGQERGE